MSTLPLPHPDIESPPPPHHLSTISGDTPSSLSSSSSSSDVHSGNSPTNLNEDRSTSLSGTEIVGVSDKRKDSSASECAVEVDLEAGGEAHLQSKDERDCRICHLSLDETNQETGIPIELGCCCKADLAAAHKHCAEAWFKIKGNKTCEICGSTASNVGGGNEGEMSMDEWNEGNDAAPPSTAAGIGIPSETRNFWQGHRFLNFLLACMVFAFVISWLFHFNVPS